MEVKVQQRRPDGGSIPPIARIVSFCLLCPISKYEEILFVGLAQAEGVQGVQEMIGLEECRVDEWERSLGRSNVMGRGASPGFICEVDGLVTTRCSFAGI